MKIKLLILIGMIVVPLLSSAQTPGTKPVFFNKGKMSVVGKDTTQTVLYVAGDFVASRDAVDKTVKSEIHLTKSKTVILGDFYQDGFLADGADENVFVLPSPADYAASASRIEFRGAGPQTIGTRLFSASNKYVPEWKAANYIEFPDIAVNNNQHVTIMPEISAAVRGLDLYKGRLILDSRRVDLSKDDLGSGSTVHNEENSSMIAHLYVDQNPTMMKYGREDISTIDDYGAVEVRVAMDDPKVSVDEKKGRSIIGMGSPFKEMRADYFMYNFLMFPWGNNILGYWNASEADPKTVVSAGKGFVVGIDLRGSEPSQYEGFEKNPDYNDISFDDRETDTYKFSRFAFFNRNNIYPLGGSMKPAGNEFTSVNTDNPAYANEQIVYDDVSVQLVTGFTYLANPFTAPLDLKELLKTSGATENAWKVKIDEVSGDIAPYAWVLNPSSLASGLYELGSNGTTQLGKERLHATYTYFLLREEGGTYNGEDFSVEAKDNDAVIAPLQMFLVYSYKNTMDKARITIPASARVKKSGANFLRSTTGESTTKKDDFVFEVADLTTNTYDRTAVVLRSPSEIMTTASYKSIDKTISSVTSDEASGDLRAVTETGAVSKTFNSVIYTKGVGGNALESKFLAKPEGAKEVSTPLYLSPSSIAQNIVIKAKRLNTMKEVNAIWLDDKRDNKSFELSTGEDYKTSVKPSDAHDRFTLRFVFETLGIEDDIKEATQSIDSYYNDGVLTVSGFEYSDMNSLISVYDIQGRVLKQIKVTDLTMRISEVFYPGAYIVKVSGNNKSYVSKFLVR